MKGANIMISFKPLFKYLKEHEISMYQMIKDGVITPTESTRIRADHNFRLSFVGRLCEYLKCKPEDIIEFIPFEPNKDNNDYDIS